MSDSKSSGGIGFFGLLQIVFIVLKLVGVIAWPWGVVLIPAWIAIAFLLVMFVIIFS